MAALILVILFVFVIAIIAACFPGDPEDGPSFWSVLLGILVGGVGADRHDD